MLGFVRKVSLRTFFRILALPRTLGAEGGIVRLVRPGFSAVLRRSARGHP